MYGWIWRRLPGAPWVRVLWMTIMFTVVVFVLFQFVFPAVEPYAPFGGGGGSISQ